MSVVVVWGPPCGGKSTYIRDRARSHDAVIDFDRISLALSVEGTRSHEAPRLARELAYRARRAAVRGVMEVAPRTAAATAWVIDSGATPQQLADWRARGAQVVVLDVPLEQCLARAAESRPPGTERIVRAWFARHRPDDLPEPEPAEPTEAGQTSRRW